MLKAWGNIICAIDTETTGLDADINEITEICIIPLDNSLNIYKGDDINGSPMKPFHIFMRPYNVDNIDDVALRVQKKTLREVMVNGVDPQVAADCFDTWFQKLPMDHGRGKRIVPLGHNYQFDKGFITKWLTATTYNDCFHYHYKDSMIAAGYINDRADFRLEPRPFDRLKLQDIVTKFCLGKRPQHTALDDAYQTALIYKRICEMFTMP